MSDEYDAVNSEAVHANNRVQQILAAKELLMQNFNVTITTPLTIVTDALVKLLRGDKYEMIKGGATTKVISDNCQRNTIKLTCGLTLNIVISTNILGFSEIVSVTISNCFNGKAWAGHYTEVDIQQFGSEIVAKQAEFELKAALEDALEEN